MSNGTEGGPRIAHETKVGLVVAGSFVLLVGVVVFCKLREGHNASPEPTAQGRIDDKVEPDEMPQPVPPPAPEIGSPTTVAPPAAGAIVPDPDPRLHPAPGTEPVVQARGAVGDTRSQPPDLLAPPATGALTPAPTGGPDVPVPTPVDSAPPTVAPTPAAPPALETRPVPTPPGDSLTPPPPPVAPPPSERESAPPALTPPAPAPLDNRGPAGPVAPLPPPAPADAAAGRLPVLPSGPGTVTPAAPAPAPPPVDGGPGVGTATGGDLRVPPPPPPAAINPPVPAAESRTPATTTGTGGTSPGASLMLPVAPSTGPTPAPAPVSGASSIGASAVAGPLRPVPDGNPTRNPIPAAPAPAGTSSPLALGTGPRLVGTPVGASAPPITVPASSAAGRVAPVPAAQVDSFDEEEHRLKAGETFPAISMQFYRTEKYAAALTLFNRSHPLASAGARQDPPVLQPGQAVFIPPTRILEKRYGSVIPELTPLPGAGTPAPTGAGTDRSVNASPGAVAPAAAPAPAYPQYRVQGKGELLWSIAERALGNGERWRDIHQLNPNLRPELPVAPGTLLYLPPDARLEPMPRQ